MKQKVKKFDKMEYFLLEKIMITVAYNDCIALQIKDEAPLNTQQLTQDPKNEVDLLLR